MIVQFVLFVIAILLVLIFWELSKINSRLKKTLVPLDMMNYNKLTKSSQRDHDLLGEERNVQR
jgi:hypothetical protein